ncbi:MAG: tryptophan synthase subunit alpha [Sarcina sp.]
MMKYKICGIQYLEEIDYINKVKPDFVGFVFSKSKRQVNKEKFKNLKASLNKRIKVVAVFKDESIEFVKEILKDNEIDIVQLHGNESLEYINSLGEIKIWKALDGDDDKLKEKIKVYEKVVERIILDYKNPGEGKSFDWSILKGLSKKKLIIAGGVNKDNLEELFKIYKPYAVDLSSSVERENKKDYLKLLEFKEKLLQLNKGNRIKRKILRLEIEKKKALVTFIPLAYPNKEKMIEYVLEMEEKNVDFVEIGYGGENPYMDGEVIKKAYEKINRENIKLDNIFEVVKSIREKTEIPLILMTYKKEIENKEKNYFKKLKDSGIDGILVPDIQYYKLKKMVGNNLVVIKVLKANDFNKSALLKLNDESFIYCISRDGKTGEGKINFDFLEKNIKKIRSYYKGKIFIGFGMGDKKNREIVKKFSDGIIIGTEILIRINKLIKNK